MKRASRILVTGAAGFIGAALADLLLARGDSVIGIDDLNDYYDVSLKEARRDRLVDAGADRFTFLKQDFSDMAGKLGFEYQVVEGLWRRWTDDQLRDLVSYSRERKVGILLWVHSRDIQGRDARRALAGRSSSDSLVRPWYASFPRPGGRTSSGCIWPRSGMPSSATASTRQGGRAAHRFEVLSVVRDHRPAL